MRLPITAVIPVKNEEKEINSLVSNLAFVDEVLFVDNGSTDKTVSLARKAGARVVSNNEKSFAKIRKYGDDNATHDWVLSMDADMRVTNELKKEINAAISQSYFDAFKIGRRNIIFGKEIEHSDWSPEDDCHMRLYNRARGRWTNDVHELWQSDGEVGRIKSSFIHHNYSDVEEYLTKMNTYSSLAVTPYKRNRVPYLMFYWAMRDFVKRYIYKLGFLDGYHGFMLAYLQGIYYLCLGVKTYENKN